MEIAIGILALLGAIAPLVNKFIRTRKEKLGDNLDEAHEKERAEIRKWIDRNPPV